MKVIAFIREKRKNLQHQNDQFIAKLEPKFKNLSNLFNNKITMPFRNTLNNPWFSQFSPVDAEESKPEEVLIQVPQAEKTYKSLLEKIDTVTFVGDWHEVEQECIDQFAEVTGDKQWIHTDPIRAAKESPFKATIAHGFLTLSLIPKLTNSVDLDSNPYPEAKMVINFGLNQVRFPYPVKAGTRVRASIKLVNLVPMKRSIEVVNEVSIEVENSKRLACVAETVLRLYF
ncbi:MULTISPECIES: MaoC family dehydratase [Colwellia]|jgi:acyl dehydratase|uniref:MaoC domain protein n=1 Tax=Colwellia psychrerythraea (strain 34H / ATCC BAA-681) TaxID=167879 RepID=Q484J6_COLP3|nr:MULTISPECIES: MaoC family dehydratase [Colwellia]AAZ27468.1 MaoC domain protein [Colwellia psychrerythraea 34H]PKH89144.1 MaoC family dehydratase [Colwellia sp. Bg11-28]